MQKYPSFKNGMFGWGRLEKDYRPEKQIWMVHDEESDIIAKNSGLKNTEVGKDLDSFGINLSEHEDNILSSSIDTNKLYDEINKEVKKSHSVYDFDSVDSESDDNKTKNKGQPYTSVRKTRYSQLVKREILDSEKDEKDENGSDSDSNDKWEIFSGQQYKYSRNSRYSQLVKKGILNWNSTNDNYEKENKDIASAGGQPKSKQKSKKKLQVVYSKPKNYMRDITNITLKDEKNMKNSIKRKLFKPRGDLENNEDGNNRSSDRRRKTVNYNENQDVSSDSSSDYEEESESEDENRNKIKKRKEKVESPTIVKTSHLSAYEQMVERNKEANRRMLEEMGIVQAKTELVETKAMKTELEKPKAKRKYTKGKIASELKETRRSHRLKKYKKRRHFYTS